MMATDCSSRSKEVCQICGQETSSRCLHCVKPVCNRSKSCYIAASEEEPGHTVSICTLCTNSKLKPCIKEHSAAQKGSNTTRQNCQNCHDCKRLQAMVHSAKHLKPSNHPNWGLDYDGPLQYYISRQWEGKAFILQGKLLDMEITLN